MRRQEEFYCSKSGGGCGKYFLTYLRENMYGNYTIECPNPNCKHHHYRTISEGIITEDRHNKKYGESEIIVGLESTLKDIPYHDDPKYRRSLIRNVITK
jgi:hypothetical protein